MRDDTDDRGHEPGLRPILELLPPRPSRPDPDQTPTPEQAPTRARGYLHLGKLDQYLSHDDDPTGIVYQHSVLCQTFLPYRDPGEAVRSWERSNGFITLKMVAGDAVDPNTRRFIPVGLPYGPKARLVLYHLNAEALRTRSPVIELAASLTTFVRHTLALSGDGRTIATVKDQLVRLAAADFRVLMQVGEEAQVLKGAFVEGFSLWAPRGGGDRTPTTVRLSPSYFESLMTRAVPLNESAVWCLAHNAMAMDIYAWLAQRLHRIDPDKGEVLVPWPRLREQFGAGYARLRKFREVFLSTLGQLRSVYPEAKLSANDRGMILKHSRPPVARRRFVVTRRDVG